MMHEIPKVPKFHDLGAKHKLFVTGVKAQIPLAEKTSPQASSGATSSGHLRSGREENPVFFEWGPGTHEIDERKKWWCSDDLTKKDAGLICLTVMVINPQNGDAIEREHQT